MLFCNYEINIIRRLFTNFTLTAQRSIDKVFELEQRYRFGDLGQVHLCNDYIEIHL